MAVSFVSTDPFGLFRATQVAPEFSAKTLSGPPRGFPQKSVASRLKVRNLSSRAEKSKKLLKKFLSRLNRRGGPEGAAYLVADPLHVNRAVRLFEPVRKTPNPSKQPSQVCARDTAPRLTKTARSTPLLTNLSETKSTTCPPPTPSPSGPFPSEGGFYPEAFESASPDDDFTTKEPPGLWKSLLHP